MEPTIVKALRLDQIAHQHLPTRARTSTCNGIRQNVHLVALSRGYAHMGRPRLEHHARSCVHTRLASHKDNVWRSNVLRAMSFGRPPTFSNFQVLPPERGSFPLDHDGALVNLTDAGECTAAMREYLACLKAHQNNNGACRHLSKAYLACRMEKCVHGG